MSPFVSSNPAIASRLRVSDACDENEMLALSAGDRSSMSASSRVASVASKSSSKAMSSSRARFAASTSSATSVWSTTQ